MSEVPETKEELLNQIKDLVEKKSKLKKPEKIAEVDAQIVDLTNQFLAAGGNPEDLVDTPAPEAKKVEIKKLYFKEPFWSVELFRSFTKGVYTPADEKEAEVLAKYDVGLEEFGKHNF